MARRGLFSNGAGELASGVADSMQKVRVSCASYLRVICSRCIHVQLDSLLCSRHCLLAYVPF
eukprot:4694046-Pyramimonas_sp.AAC.1